MNTSPIYFQERLKGIRGCLSPKKTIIAHRRKSPHDDEDLLVEGVDPFLIDAEFKIAPSKAIRRMLDKTQVMTNPLNLHIRKRITHCGEVTGVASITAAILGLNVELTKAIALGHDMGHPPFGHDGERFLQEATGKRFFHEVMAVVIAQHIERWGAGLNLTHEVLRGFVRDARTDNECGNTSLTPEAELVAWADRFAYVTGDYNDVARIQYKVSSELKGLMDKLGNNQRQRINTLMGALCLESAEEGKISFCKSEAAQVFLLAKKAMYDVYGILNASNSRDVLERIYRFLVNLKSGADPALLLALMTDQDVLFLANIPVLDFSSFHQVTVAELLPSLQGREIKWWEPDLDW